MKKIFLGVLTLSLVLQAQFVKKDKIVIAGPFASVSHPIMKMIESNALKDVAKKVEFKLWKNPDELRAIVLKNGANFTAIPTNVAANLYNKGVDIKLLNVSTWGILGLVSRDNTLKTLKDFKGKEILVPFREDMPDIVLKQLMIKQGLDPKKDFKLKYVSSPIDAMQMLILRRADHALLAEPAISMALRKTKSFPMKVIAPDLYRSIDLQEQWGKTFNTKEEIPQAGIAQIGNQDEYVVKRFLEEYDKALAWYKQNPKKAAKLTVKTLKMLKEDGLADSIPYVKLYSKKASDSKKDLEFFFNTLKESEPKLIGGKLPDDKFYYGN